MRRNGIERHAESTFFLRGKGAVDGGERSGQRVNTSSSPYAFCVSVSSGCSAASAAASSSSTGPTGSTGSAVTATASPETTSPKTAS